MHVALNKRDGCHSNNKRDWFSPFSTDFVAFPRLDRFGGETPSGLTAQDKWVEVRCKVNLANSNNS